MITQKYKKDEFIANGSEIEQELYRLFDKHAELWIGDLGACDGLSSVIYARMFPNARFHCFEPVEDNVGLLRANVEEYGIKDRVVIYPYALGNTEGKIKFYRSFGQAEWVKDWETGNKSSSILPPGKHLDMHKWCKFREESVEIRKLDSFNIPAMDFAHIDVQGAELQLIRGGMKTLKKCRAIWIEVANVELYKGQGSKMVVSRALDGLGFRIELDTCGYNKTGDMLWVKR